MPSLVPTRTSWDGVDDEYIVVPPCDSAIAIAFLLFYFVAHDTTRHFSAAEPGMGQN
jgi:hypothetical protein